MTYKADDGFDPIQHQAGFDAGFKAGCMQSALVAENYPTIAPSSEFVVQTTMEVAAESIAMTIRNLIPKD